MEQLQLAKTAFEPFFSAAKRLVNSFRGQGQAPLKNGQREADRACALVVLEDKAAQHAARCAPYLHHKLVAVERSQNRKLSAMTTEELEARRRRRGRSSKG